MNSVKISTERNDRGPLETCEELFKKLIMENRAKRKISPLSGRRI